jgi:hypothetical protein
MVPLINNAGATLRWFVEDVWAQFGDDHTRPGVPLLPSERKNADGSAARVGDEALRAALAEAARTHLPDWPGVVTPHVLRHFCVICTAFSGRGTTKSRVRRVVTHKYPVLHEARTRRPVPASFSLRCCF